MLGLQFLVSLQCGIQAWVGKQVALSLPGSGSGQGRRRGQFLLAVALGTGVHVVPDTDGLFEQAFHTTEVHAAVHQALHSTETEGSEGQFLSWQQQQPRIPL